MLSRFDQSSESTQTFKQLPFHSGVQHMKDFRQQSGVDTGGTNIASRKDIDIIWKMKQKRKK